MEDFIYLNFEDVLGYYRETIEQSGGGMSGIREQAEIEKVLDFVQNDLYYPSLEDKLTYMVFAFCTGHYFADGNKRISLVIGAHFLIKNKRGWAGFHFLPYMEAYIWHVAAGNIDKELLAKIIFQSSIEKNLTKVPSWKLSMRWKKVLCSPMKTMSRNVIYEADKE